MTTSFPVRLLSRLVGRDVAHSSKNDEMRVRADGAQELRDAMAALVDWAAHAVCEPRRFLENEDDAQQELGRAVARARTALRADWLARASSADASPLPSSPVVPRGERHG